VFLLRRVSPNPAFGRNVGYFMPRKKMSGGNIKAESAYDPFPRSGLVKQFEPFIRKEVGKFCKLYPKLRRDNWMMGVLSGTDTRSLVQFADDQGISKATPRNCRRNWPKRSKNASQNNSGN